MMDNATRKVAESVGGVKAELYFSGLKERVRLDKEISTLRESLKRAEGERDEAKGIADEAIADLSEAQAETAAYEQTANEAALELEEAEGELAGAREDLKTLPAWKERAEEAVRFYRADGTYETYPPSEVKHKHLAAAKELKLLTSRLERASGLLKLTAMLDCQGDADLNGTMPCVETGFDEEEWCDPCAAKAFLADGAG